MSLLETINSPEQLRQFSPECLQQIVEELRQYLLQVISEKGGHLASNLGSAELTVALHYVFETPKDKLVWDVGHQAYGHKILTGRRDRFSTIRQHEGLSGFTCRTESEYDHFGAGHASTSISAALGIAEGLRHRGLPNLSIAVIGDGSLTGGLAFEAMNNAGHIPAKNLVVVVNDNEMSIDPNVGAIAKFINHAVTHPGYNRFRKEIRSVLESLTDHGLPLTSLAGKVRKSVKNVFTPGMIFECFGFRYFGPIDGHDIAELVETFKFIKNEGPEGGPYLVHALTTKGKGYQLAEENAVKYHGVSPFKVEDGIVSGGVKKANYQDVFAESLIKLAKEDPRIVAITAAMPSGTGLIKFQKEFPNRCYDVGIAEGHAVLFAAGLATEGYRPVAAIYSTFLQRAYDQIIHDVALQNLPVIFAMDRAGLVGADGATHQGSFDISYLRCIPNMVLMAPKDENELQHMLKTAVQYQQGPIALRYPRGEVVGVTMDKDMVALPIGRGEVIATDSDRPEVLFIGYGCGVHMSVEARHFLKQEGITSAVINARFAKPLDEGLLIEWMGRAQLVVTVEEQSVMGGFGSAILELLAAKGLRFDIMNIGIPDYFVDHASPKIQHELTGLDGAGIARQVSARFKKNAEQVGIIGRPVSDVETPLLTKH